jgi:eukaryotic-like serine/threonine-protein kinase
MTISDRALDRLKSIVAEPDLSGTRYRILRRAGEGGMGTVYEAEDTVLRRRVALKVIQPAESFLGSAAAGQLLEEARILASLEHPGIVPVHDAGVLPDGNIYYTMKYVDGHPLASEGSIADRLRTFQKICEAVAFAHAHGIVHRDLKPQNIMVGAFGEVLVMDWGVARILGSRTEPPGTVVGTPEYMAPEQARGEVERVDKRADVFALGGILQTLLADRKADRPLRAICATAKAAAPDERYADAMALSNDIRRYLNGEPVSVYKENLLERCRRIVLNNQAAFALVAAYLIMRVLVFFLLRI